MVRPRPVSCLIAGLLLQSCSMALASDCTRTSVGFVPLTDLASGLYQGYEGGLYAGGSNTRPPAHEAAGLAIANAVSPLDTLGNPDANGRIVLISIGMSNTTQEFSAFVPLANADPARNPRVLVVDCAQGGQAAGDINTPSAAYWNTVYARLRAAGSAPAQAQVVWLKEAERGPSAPFPASAEVLMRDLGTIVRIIKDKLPNARLCYLSSRIYAGYATTALNPEPYAYESGFSVKWLIGSQIAGVDSLEYDAGAGPVEAPWLSWGPYLWADGLNARSDGLTWQCSDFSSDGTHPATGGRTIVADALLDFFKSDATAMPWFVRATTGLPNTVRSSDLALALAPNPARGPVSATVRVPAGRAWRLEILDASGRHVVESAHGIGSGAAQTWRWDSWNGHHAGPPAGVYWAVLSSGDQRATRRFARLE